MLLERAKHRRRIEDKLFQSRTRGSWLCGAVGLATALSERHRHVDEAAPAGTIPSVLAGRRTVVSIQDFDESLRRWQPLHSRFACLIQIAS